MLRKTLIIATLLCLAQLAKSQSVKTDSASLLNAERITTNRHGMHVLEAWGLANVAGGAAGYFATSNKEWKDFSLMNLSWGVVNAGIAYMGLGGVRQEMINKTSCNDMLQRYESNKRLYLINAGLDAVYIGTGLFLWEHSNTVTNHAELWSGFGKSIALQGLFLLIFDSTMYASHQSKNKRWYRITEGLCITNNGIGLRYAFK